MPRDRTSWKRLAQPGSVPMCRVSGAPAAPDRDLGGAVGEGGVDRVEDLRHPVEAPVAPRIAVRKRLAVEAQQDVVEPQAGPVGGSAGHQREHARPGVETERPNRRRPEVRAILRKVVDREAGKVCPVAAQVAAGDREAMADRRDALVERAHRDQRRPRRSCWARPRRPRRPRPAGRTINPRRMTRPIKTFHSSPRAPVAAGNQVVTGNGHGVQTRSSAALLPSRRRSVQKGNSARRAGKPRQIWGCQHCTTVALPTPNSSTGSSR